MIGLPSSVRIFLFVAPVDMRNGFDGLSALVRRSGGDEYSGHLFVFLSRRLDRVKILTWESGGFVLWTKRLELGRFKLPRLDVSQTSITLDAGQLLMLLDGVDFSKVRRIRKWQPPQKNATGSGSAVDCGGSGIDRKRAL